MRFIFFQNDNTDVVRWLITKSFCGSSFVDALVRSAGLKNGESAGLLVPSDWTAAQVTDQAKFPFFSYTAGQWEFSRLDEINPSEDVWLMRGESVIDVDHARLYDLIEQAAADIVTFQVNPDLKGSHEIVRLTSDNSVVGFRRFYEPSYEPTQTPFVWPTFVWFRQQTWEKITSFGSLVLDTNVFFTRFQDEDFAIKHFQIGGNTEHLNTISNALNFMERSMAPQDSKAIEFIQKAGARVFGPIWMGQQVKINPGAIIVGPTVLSDHVTVESDSTVRRSIVGPHVTISKGQRIDQAFIPSPCDSSAQTASPASSLNNDPLPSERFRRWPFLSYGRLGKRVFDLIGSVLILVLLLPIFLVVFVMLKWDSSSEVFYRARRQGLYGKEFDCLKFRTMIVQADQMQHRLQMLNQVDGPQFKIDDDPRISALGKFLRDTCIDELPQFINVLLGQMSIVGPRPSPESENESCPFWRDARLSVRPGITGLWQTSRTRQPFMDFQEWLHYDTEYVRNLSFRKDIRICLKTANKLIHTFLDQFG
jgi:lipopolysaccharide/colanic/teichoic acid biosynthesis glycosyltransferase